MKIKLPFSIVIGIWLIFSLAFLAKAQHYSISGRVVDNQTMEAARRIATDFGAAFIPYQTIYNEALKKAPVDYWSLDGVHPSAAGCQLMSHAWLNTLQMMNA